ncbi:MAG: Transcriptional repressor SmtB [Acidimicrobiales bacterium]|nr:MAG: transcriptional regulator [Actinomycetota bacterium]MBV6508876.1 Transcriptional repressor SmtB [Acidimicrobiales bacterium]RIK05004.1 MAG: transcriptional regulator [Acidobacteriota bacterium]
MSRSDLVPSCCGPVLHGVLSESEATELADNFKVLADPARLRLLSVIAAQPGSEACVCDLVDVVDRSQPTVSHHLKVLTEAGLVKREKRGRWAWFSLVPARIEALRAALAPR